MKPQSHASSESAKVCNSGFGAQLPCPQKRKGIGLDPRKKVNLSNPQHDLTTVIYLLYLNMLLFYVIHCRLRCLEGLSGCRFGPTAFGLLSVAKAAGSHQLWDQATMSYCTDLYNVSQHDSNPSDVLMFCTSALMKPPFRPKRRHQFNHNVGLQEGQHGRVAGGLGMRWNAVISLMSEVLRN